jgi:NitT/TauT family transport system ATP-binding protein
MWSASEMTAILVTHSIVEAVFLSDRVIVLSPKPGTVLDILTIDLPRPRTLAMRETPQFTAYVGHLRKTFEGMGVFGPKS